MTIEATLAAIAASLANIETMMASGAQLANAVFVGAEPGGASQTAVVEAPKTARKASKKEAEATPVVDGDVPGTVYWLSEASKLVFSQTPNDKPPENAADNGFSQVTPTVYLAKKSEFEAAEVAAKNAQAAAATPAPAPTEPSATAPAGTASAKTSAVAFADVINKLKELAGNKDHGGTAVKKIINDFGGGKVPNVPGLEALGKNAEIVAAVDALLAPAGADDDAALFG